MVRGDGRSAPKTATKSQVLHVRVYPRELKLLQKMADKHGMNHTDYLMLLLSCRPVFSDLRDADDDMVESIRKYGSKKEHLLFVGEGAAEDLFRVSNQIKAKINEVDDSCRMLQKNVEDFQHGTPVDVTVWLSMVEARMAEVEECAVLLNKTSRALLDAANRRSAKPVKRVYVTAKPGVLFPKKELDGDDASTAGFERGE